MLPDLLSDARLVRGARRGDSFAIEALILRYQRKAYAVARAIQVNLAEPDDIVQEATLLALQNLPALEKPASFGSWFLTIVRNVARKAMRPARSSACASAVLDELPGAAENPVESHGVRELNDRLWSEVARLPHPVREAMFLFYYEGESVRRVAAAQGTTVATAKKRLQKGRDLLRERLWERFATVLRELLPSTREWGQRGRRMALVCATSLAVVGTQETLLVSAASPAISGAGAGGAKVASGVGTLAASGGLFMAKKAMLVAAVLAVGGSGVGLWMAQNGAASPHEPAVLSVPDGFVPREQLVAAEEQLEAASETLAMTRSRLRELEARLAGAQAQRLPEVSEEKNAEVEPSAASAVDLSRLGDLVAENLDLIERMAQSRHRRRLSPEDMSRAMEVMGQFLKVGRALREKNAYPFFDDELRGDLVSAIFGKSLGLTDEQLESIATLSASTSDLQPEEILPVERYRLRRETLEDVLETTETVLTDEQMEDWETLRKFSNHVLDGEAAHYRYGIDQEGLSEVVAADVRELFELTDTQEQTIQPYVAEYLDSAESVVREHLESQEGEVEFTFETHFELMGSLLDSQSQLEEKILPQLNPEQVDAYMEKPPTVLHFAPGSVTEKAGGPPLF